MDPVLNFCVVTVSAGYDNSTTTIGLNPGHGSLLPDPSVSGAFNVTWWDGTSFSNPQSDPLKEIIRINTLTVDTLGISRAQEGTTANNHNTGGSTYKLVLTFTKKTYDDFVNGILTKYSATGGNITVTSITASYGLLNSLTSNSLSSFGITSASGNINSITSNEIDFSSITTPSAPATNNIKVYGTTTQGHTRLAEADDDGIEVILGRDNFFVARNTTGLTITKGQVVSITGSTGNVPNLALARADSQTTLPAAGVVMADINNNAFGYVMTLGIISSINTSSYSSGDRIYLSPTVGGAYQTTRPVYPPYFAQRVGSVLVSGVGNGSLYVAIAPFIGGMESGSNAQVFFVGTLSANNLTAFYELINSVTSNSISSAAITAGTLSANSITSASLSSFAITSTSGNFQYIYGPDLDVSRIRSNVGLIANITSTAITGTAGNIATFNSSIDNIANLTVTSITGTYARFNSLTSNSLSSFAITSISANLQSLSSNAISTAVITFSDLTRQTTAYVFVDTVPPAMFYG